MSATNRPEVIACTLSSGDLVTRGQRWHGLADRSGVGSEETELGLRLVFRADTDAERELHELAALERDCCAFAAWDVTRDGDNIVLDVTAEGDAIGAVQAMFGSVALERVRVRAARGS